MDRWTADQRLRLKSSLLDRPMEAQSLNDLHRFLACGKNQFIAADLGWAVQIPQLQSQYRQGLCIGRLHDNHGSRDDVHQDGPPSVVKHHIPVSDLL